MLCSRTVQLLSSKTNRGLKYLKRWQSTASPAFQTQNNILRREQTVVIPDITLPEAIWERTGAWSDKIATVCSATGRAYTYADLQKRTLNIAKALRGRLKLRPGQTVAILLPNVPEYPIAFLGITEANLVATTVNPLYTAEEIARQLIDSDTQAIITLVEYHDRAVQSTIAAKRKIPIITIKTQQNEATPAGAIDFAQFSETATDFDLRPGNPEDIIVMPYSSGTTGLPKGVELSHRNILSNLFQVVDFDPIFQRCTDTHQEIVPSILPMFHIYGMTVNMFKLLHIGCKIVTVPKFTPDTYVDLLAKHRPNHLLIVPPIVIFMAAHSSVTAKHLSSVRSIISGAAPLGTADMERFLEKAGKDIIALQGYGMTETAPAICMTPSDIWRECLGSVGRIVCNTEAKIVALDDATGTPLGPNEKGELFVRGPQVMRRYHNNPKATEEVFLDGWLRTGDMAYYDEQQILWLTDRLKELIKVKGFQVAPAELEEVIRDHPQIADAAVIGIPHPLFGEVPKAYIVPKSKGQVSSEDIQEYVAGKVASYKKLEGGVTILETIPKTASGKIMRRTLRQMYDESEH